MYKRRNRGERLGPHVSFHGDGYTVKDFRICGVFASLRDANQDAIVQKAMELEEDSEEDSNDAESEKSESSEAEEPNDKVPFKYFREEVEGEYNYGDLFIEVEKYRLK